MLLFSGVLQNTVFAQKEKNIWYFGGGFALGPTSGSGIDFNASPPTLLIRVECIPMRDLP